jgi:hypothetical protein
MGWGFDEYYLDSTERKQAAREAERRSQQQQNEAQGTAGGGCMITTIAMAALPMAAGVLAVALGRGLKSRRA